MFKRVVKWLWRIGASLIVMGVAFVVYANLSAVWAGKGRIYDELKEVPACDVGLVFGCDDEIDGQANRYFTYRIDAAAELYHAGKVKVLLLTGDNPEKYYNEPQAMFEALVEQGVPEDKMVKDFAGRRTLDSVVRAREIFGVDSVIFVSQKFHNERAAYIGGKRYGNEWQMYGYNAKDVTASGGLKTKGREVLARVKMWLDVKLWNTQPQVMGDKEALPL